MSSIFSEYTVFMFRPVHAAGRSAVDDMPSFWNLTTIWIIAFSAVYLLIPRITNRCFPSWYNSMDIKKRNDYPSYVVCLIHHMAMVPFAWYRIYKDFQLTDAVEIATHNYGISHGIVGPFCIAYLVSDTLFYALKEMRKRKFEYIIHHTLTLTVVMTTMLGDSSACRFISHMLICDTTAALFNTAWLLRLAGLRGHSIVTLLEVLFAVTFLFTRAINMPIAFLAVTYTPAAEHWSSAAKLAMIPMAGLQWYWFYKIVSTIGSRLFSSSSPVVSSKKD